MLKLLQEGVNATTKRINKLDDKSAKRSDLALHTAKKQRRVEELTRKLARKMQKQDDVDAADGGDGR